MQLVVTIVDLQLQINKTLLHIEGTVSIRLTLTSFSMFFHNSVILDSVVSNVFIYSLLHPKYG